MLCEKCKKEMVRKSRNEAVALSAKLGIGGVHSVNITFGVEWYPGGSKKDLEDWCAKNCKPAKPVELVKEVKKVKEVKEEVITPTTKKVEMVGSNTSWNYKNKKKD